jgi:hypothetical protein
MATQFAAQHLGVGRSGGAQIPGADRSGSDWAIVRDVFVADKDEMAWQRAVKGGMGRMFREYLIPLMSTTKTDRLAAEYYAAGPNVTFPEITADPRKTIGSSGRRTRWSEKSKICMPRSAGSACYFFMPATMRITRNLGAAASSCLARSSCRG